MDSNLTNLGYVEETTFGTTPSANLQLLRRTGGNLAPEKTTVRSNEIRSDLRPGQIVQTSRMCGGQVQVEWSYGTLDDILEGMLLEAWLSNVLVDGTTKKSYSFEEQFVDPAISPSQYMIYKGCRIGSLSISLALDSIVSGSFGVMGATPSIAQASAGTGNTAETTSEPFNCTSMLTTLQEESASLSKVVGVDINIDRSLRAKKELGSLNPFDIGVGRLLVTGTIQQYFEDDVLMDAYFAHTDRTFEAVLNDGSNSLTIEIAKMRYTGRPEISNPGPDGDRIVRVPFEAWADTNDTHLIRFTRA